MNRAFAVAATVALLCVGGVAQADVFNLGEGFTNLEAVTVGDPGNAGELSGSETLLYGPERVCGSVDYNYRIGKYEVTAAQYCDFLNHKAKSDGDPYGLYSSLMTGEHGCQIQRSGTPGNYAYSVQADWANRPVQHVSFWDACRFANWLHNGQGDGDTETGAYTLDGYNGDDGRTIQRNAGWKWAVTSEDEWYKAAYYKGGGTNGGYWDHPMQSDIPTTPSNDITDPDPGNNANSNDDGFAIGSPYYRTNVGEFENSESAYGTFDQGGNVWEWNEAIVYLHPSNENLAYRGRRGGQYHFGASSLQAWVRTSIAPSFEGGIGFRVSEVPEPSTILALLFGLGGLVWRRRW